MVDPGQTDSKLWGGSDRTDWQTGNFNLETTPHKEWRFAFYTEWDGQVVAETVGGCEKDADGVVSRQETMHLRRKAVAIETYFVARAPGLIFKMLSALAEQHGKAFADADGDGVVDEKDMLAEENIHCMYEKVGINRAELTGLWLYTGPMFEVRILRACATAFSHDAFLVSLTVLGCCAVLQHGSPGEGQEGAVGQPLPSARRGGHIRLSGCFVTTIHAINSVSPSS